MKTGEIYEGRVIKVCSVFYGILRSYIVPTAASRCLLGRLTKLSGVVATIISWGRILPPQNLVRPFQPHEPEASILSG